MHFAARWCRVILCSFWINRKGKAGIWLGTKYCASLVCLKSNYRVPHHILPGVLPRWDEDVVPGQGQQQSQGNHVEFKVPNDDDKKLRSRERRQNTSAEEKSRQAERVKVAYIWNPPLTPYEYHSRKLKPTICAVDHDALSNALTCSVITTMERGTKIRVNWNKGTGLLFVSVGSPRWPWRPPPAISLKRRTARRMSLSHQSPFTPCQSSQAIGAVLFSAAGRQSWSIHTQVWNTSLWPHTPRVPNPVTPGPNTLSASPKGSCAPSLTFSAPICQNHNPYNSPLITRQERYHLKN